MAHVITTLGPKSAHELGMILPHEHVFVDLRTWDQPGYAQAEASEVVALMKPEIEKIQAQGVTALVEPSAVIVRIVGAKIVSEDGLDAAPVVAEVEVISKGKIDEDEA